VVTLLNARSARFSDRLYESLLVAKICLEMCATDRITTSKIRKIDQYAVRV